MKTSKIPAGKLREDLEFLKFFHSSGFMKDLPLQNRRLPPMMCDASSARERLYNFKAIRCTQPTCRCECFSPGKSFLRTCDTCKHGWVSHALEKLGYRTMYQLGMQVEVVQPNIVFDIASLILYGAQATPIRLKILLDRLFSVLQHDEVLQVLHGFGWSYEDYARGYILQDPSGRVLDKWLVTTREEEQVILQQFLRFGETKSIAQEIILQDARDNREKQNFQMSPKSESEIKKFIERSNIGMQSFMRGYDPRAVVGKAVPFPVSPTPGSAAAVRMLSPVAVPTFPSPGGTARDRGGMLLPVSPANTLAGSPLTRLQTMQPFDYRRDHLSPTSSPVASEKSGSTSIMEHRSPQNLSMGATTPSSLSSALSPGQFTPMCTPVKSEVVEEKTTPTSVHGTPAKADPSIMDGVLNFSMKDQKSLANTIPHQLQSPAPVQVSPRSHSPRTPPASVISANSHYAEQKIKHLRKSSNPMKRPWQPTPGYGGTLISPSGKKRVLCTACNKTFCDKGALKIHYSAVHLKEMHKCTVDGCNMMFSSRRSRNRHSANPNPKLHMPQARRKLPDGGIAGMVDDCKDDLSPPPTPHLPPPPTSAHMPPVMPGLIGTPCPPVDATPTVVPMPVENKVMPKIDNVIPPPPLPLAPTGTNSAGEMIYYLDPSALAGIPAQLLPNPPKVPKMDDGTPGEQAGKDSDHSTSKGRSSSKRKRLVPTRCAQMEESFVLSDENSNDGITVLDDDEQIQDHINKSRKCEESSRKGSSDEEEDGMNFEEDDSEEGIMGEIESSADDEESSVCLNSPLKAVDRESEHKPVEYLPEISNMDQSSEPNLVENPSKPCTDGQCPSSTGTDVANLDDVSAPEDEDSKDEDAGDDKDEDMDIDDENAMNQSINVMDDIPLDKDNPKKCPGCGKIFMNLFTVKMHYQNVHLKLMHKCTVEGCNAAFPSKRSRDRHSSNINLHRKLLSTSGSESEMNSRNLSLREEFLPRIYDSQPFIQSVNVDAGVNGATETNNNNSSGLAVISDDNSPGPLVNGKDVVHDDRESDEDSGVEQQDGDSDDTEVYNAHPTIANGNAGELNGKESGPDADPNGTVSCHVCNKLFRDNLILKEHFEKNHPKEMYRCTIHGCDKIFSTRKSRNRHSQNDNLHRHLSPAKANCAI